jgi:hypothetical protein
MARMVATKAALSIRVDALTDSDGKSEIMAPSIGIENRAKLESRLRALEHQGDSAGVRRFADNGKKQAKFEMGGDTKTYNTQADAVDLVSTQREDPMAIAVKVVLDVKEEKRRAKEERRAKKRAEKEKSEVVPDVSMDVDGEGEDDEKKAKKDKKRKRRESEAVNADDAADDALNKVCLFFLSWSRLTTIISGRDGRGAEGKEEGAESGEGGRRGKRGCRVTEEEEEEKVGGLAVYVVLHSVAILSLLGIFLCDQCVTT